MNTSNFWLCFTYFYVFMTCIVMYGLALSWKALARRIVSKNRKYRILAASESMARNGGRLGNGNCIRKR